MAVGPESKCGTCGTKWIEDQSSCPVCGASIQDMVGGIPIEPPPEVDRPSAEAETAEALPTEAPTKPSKPVLAPAPPLPAERPVLVRKKGGRASTPERVDDKRRRPGEKPKAVPRPKPVLAATPSPVPSPEPAPLPAAALQVPDRVDDADVPQTSGGKSAQTTQGAKKTAKRELPPYLRVVK
jgi:hypothetical protein